MSHAPVEVEKNIKSVTAPSRLEPFLLAILTSFLLTLAFPRWNLWGLAWIALVPLFYALNRSRNWQEAFFIGFSAGFVFFLLSISWLRHVTVFGMFFVVAMEAVYGGIFGGVYWIVGTHRRAHPMNGAQTHRFPPSFLLAACWTALEFIRAEIPVWGFGWNLLGTSQASNLWIAQLASLGGVYSVSFLVFWGNGAIYSFLRDWKKNLLSAILFLLAISTTVFYGSIRIHSFKPEGLLRVSVLQGNIPQILKWDLAHKEEILRVYLNLTELSSYDSPQLILWPEAAYPGIFNREELADQVRRSVRQIQIPLLIGSPHQEAPHLYYNSAYLFNTQGDAAERYDKLRLVPFGEYVPWRSLFGFLERFAYSLGVSDFSPGKRLTVFHLGEAGAHFSVMICFEDTFPDLARKFVDRGADFLAVLTNDAWFGHSSAPYQHLQASVFRAIENGVPVVRAANTGVSGFITPRGEVAERVKNQKGDDTFIMGGTTYPVAWMKEKTLFRQGGWLFPYGCLAALVIMLFSFKQPAQIKRSGP